METIWKNDRKLGFGLMRLPLLDPEDPASIDLDTMNQMVDAFIENGFTYFDTAWMYCGFASESFAKEALVKRHPRNSFTLTTKLHAGFLKTKEDRDRIFDEQLNKTGVEYFDYYLLHDMGKDHFKIYTELDCFEWLKRKKAEGKVKHIGFSFHDSADVLDEVLQAHPEMEFVQLQLNYLDWNDPAIQSRKCLEIARKHNKPVIVMEPVKGGTLASLPTQAEALLKQENAKASIPSWAIRFAASQEGVALVLSGMSTMEQLEDNMGFMKDFIPLSKEEEKKLTQVRKILEQSQAIPCTGCSYCVDGCPQQIPIPKYFSLYNLDLQEAKEKGWTPQGEYYDRLSQSHGKASACISCRRCEGICPQHLSITKYLKEVADHFE